MYGIQGDYASINQMRPSLNDLGLYQENQSYYELIARSSETTDIIFSNGESDTRPLLLEAASQNHGLVIIRLEWLNDDMFISRLNNLGYSAQNASSPSEFIRTFHASNRGSRVLISPTLNHETLNAIGLPLYPSGPVLSLDQPAHGMNFDMYSRSIQLVDNTISQSDRAMSLNLLPWLKAAYQEADSAGDENLKAAIKNDVRIILEQNGKLSLLESILN